MKREYKLFLKDIVKSCEYIQKFVEGIDFDQFLKNEKHRAQSSKSSTCAVSQAAGAYHNPE